MDKKREIIEEIKNLKRIRNAVIVAHNYQIEEVQDIADMIGDSLELSRYCASSSAEVIVFCGVHFMAESAKILSPNKIVLLPEKDAGCPMANMIDPEALRKKKMEYPEAGVVGYVNTTAAVKAECDICCTSSNAIKICNSMPHKEIIFVPDRNLGHYVSLHIPEKKFILWEGFCATHYKIKPDEVQKVKKLHPDAVILVHPECQPEVVNMADFVGSTKQIIDYARTSNKTKFIIGTEMGILYKLKKENPEKQFYLLSQGLICPNMKKTTLESVYTALKEMKYQIELDETIRQKAYNALQKMLQLNIKIYN